MSNDDRAGIPTRCEVPCAAAQHGYPCPCDDLGDWTLVHKATEYAHALRQLDQGQGRHRDAWSKRCALDARERALGEWLYESGVPLDDASEEVERWRAAYAAWAWPEIDFVAVSGHTGHDAFVQWYNEAHTFIRQRWAVQSAFAHVADRMVQGCAGAN